MQPIFQQPDIVGSLGNNFFQFIVSVLDRFFSRFAFGNFTRQAVVGRF
jgi:hypothetical protein